MSDFNHNGGFTGGFIAMPSMGDIQRLERRIEDLERRLAVLESHATVGEENSQP